MPTENLRVSTPTPLRFLQIEVSLNFKLIVMAGVISIWCNNMPCESEDSHFFLQICMARRRASDGAQSGLLHGKAACSENDSCRRACTEKVLTQFTVPAAYCWVTGVQMRKAGVFARCFPHTYANLVRPSQAIAAPILNLHELAVSFNDCCLLAFKHSWINGNTRVQRED